MADKPFQTISITEIVEHAGYNRGTFYANYENKEGLLDEIVSGLLDKLLQAFRAPYEHVEVFNVIELLATYSMSAVLGLVWHWIETGFKHPPAYMQEQLVKIINLYPTIADTSLNGKQS
ncbi:TetR/AcrR family transcriptional regulator [Paenibacillus sp. KS-LC4]|uniref:TetR/AcrR family transcriptional regulator n=1 Tax=Paenibacillus sp. KS-LC4 TaxID=2979727 RepID=UPI0030CCD8F6